jgi:hypothetical protein
MRPPRSSSVEDLLLRPLLRRTSPPSSGSRRATARSRAFYGLKALRLALEEMGGRHERSGACALCAPSWDRRPRAGRRRRTPDPAGSSGRSRMCRGCRTTGAVARSLPLADHRRLESDPVAEPQLACGSSSGSTRSAPTGASRRAPQPPSWHRTGAGCRRRRTHRGYRHRRPAEPRRRHDRATTRRDRRRPVRAQARLAERAVGHQRQIEASGLSVGTTYGARLERPTAHESSRAPSVQTPPAYW